VLPAYLDICMICELCEKDPKPGHFAERRRCAFEAEEFSRDNWQCGTMNALRDAGEAFSLRDDEQNGSICVVPIPWNDNQLAQGYIVLGYYKNRGRTGSAVIVEEDEEPRRLTHSVAALVAAEFLKATNP
jgi:hypothetical protein